MGNLIDSLKAEFIGRAVSGTRFYSTAGKPSGKAPSIVIPTFGGIALSCGLTPKFGGANNQCILKHTTRF